MHLGLNSTHALKILDNPLRILSGQARRGARRIQRLGHCLSGAAICQLCRSRCRARAVHHCVNCVPCLRGEAAEVRQWVGKIFVPAVVAFAARAARREVTTCL